MKFFSMSFTLYGVLWQIIAAYANKSIFVKITAIAATINDYGNDTIDYFIGLVL